MIRGRGRRRPQRKSVAWTRSRPQRAEAVDRTSLEERLRNATFPSAGWSRPRSYPHVFEEIQKSLRLPRETPLADGSYLSRIYPRRETASGCPRSAVPWRRPTAFARQYNRSSHVPQRARAMPPPSYQPPAETQSTRALTPILSGPLDLIDRTGLPAPQCAGPYRQYTGDGATPVPNDLSESTASGHPPGQTPRRRMTTRR